MVFITKRLDNKHKIRQRGMCLTSYPFKMRVSHPSTSSHTPAGCAQATEFVWYSTRESPQRSPAFSNKKTKSRLMSVGGIGQKWAWGYFCAEMMLEGISFAIA